MTQHRLAFLALAALLLIPGCQRSSERKIRELEQRVGFLRDRNEELQAQVKHLSALLVESQNRAKSLARQVGEPIGTYAEAARRRLLYDDRTGLWDVKWPDKEIEWRPVLVKKYDPDKTTPKMLADAINRHYPGPGVRVIRIKDGIAFVRLRDPEALTERMGTSGAGSYTAMLVLTLTSLPDVDHVYLYGFEDGSHMGPGCWSRADIAQWDF